MPLSSSFFIPNLFYSIIFHLMILTNLPWLSWLNFFLYLAHFPLSLHLYYSTLFSHIWLLSKTPLTPRRHMYHSNLSLRVALWAPPTHDPSPAARVWCGICLCAVVVTACQAVRRCHAGQVHGPASEKLHCIHLSVCTPALGESLPQRITSYTACFCNQLTCYGDCRMQKVDKKSV